VSVVATDDGRLAAEWVMRGTDTGGYAGLPPTGKEIGLAGADVVRVVDAGIESIEGYFDSAAIPRQLGLDVIVQPSSRGPGRSASARRRTSATAPCRARSA
jgi:hypothetical protein